MSEYSKLIADAKPFYTALAANNTKAWWTDNKPTYDSQLKAPALALLDDVAGDLATLTDLQITTKLFRPHRDVRFSKDKTPYNTHLHMLWMAETGARQDIGFFFGIGIDYISVGGGIMAFDKPVLEDWRKFVDLDTNRVTGILSEVEAKGFSLREPELKRVPPAYDKDHTAAEHLRRKGCVAWKELPDTAGLPTDLTAAFRDLWPLQQLLIQIVEA